MRILGGFAPSLFGVVFAPALALAQSREIVHGDGSVDSNFGSAATVIGDVDGDGRVDLLVSAPTEQTRGSVTVRSGRDGSELRRHDAEQDGSLLEGAVERLADVNGDGVVDYVVSAPNFFDAAQMKTCGKLYVHSGADGALLWSLLGVGDLRVWGTQLVALGDANGDGATDFVVNKARGGAAHGGRVELLSGVDGSSLWVADAPVNSDGLGTRVARVRDVDGDGVDEVAATSPNHSGTNTNGMVTLFSGATGAELWHVEGAPFEHFAETLAAAGDVDADGVDDVAVGAPWRGTQYQGAVEFFSGVDGRPLGEIDGDANALVGLQFSAAADFDGDGDPDLAIAHVGAGNDVFLSIYDVRSATRIAEVRHALKGAFAFMVLAPAGDVDGDGFVDLLVGIPQQRQVGVAFVYAMRSPPALAAVAPTRGDHHSDTPVTITGSGFLLAQSLQVHFGATAATNVAVVDDATITCTAPADVPGPVDVTVATDAGSATATNGFARTPATVLEGDDFLGGNFTERTLCDAGDTLLGLVGLAPEVSIPLPPFEGSLCISPFVILFLEPAFANDEKDLVATIPNDPSLSGLDLLFQSLVGPQLSGHGKSGSLTNCAHLKIQ